MANIQSAKKRIKTSRKRQLRNKARKERLKKAIKSFQRVLKDGDATKISEELKAVCRAVDKAGSKGILHKNTAARKKSRLCAAAKRVAA